MITIRREPPPAYLAVDWFLIGAERCHDPGKHTFT
jgi:hypothetical protein